MYLCICTLRQKRRPGRGSTNCATTYSCRQENRSDMTGKICAGKGHSKAHAQLPRRAQAHRWLICGIMLQ